MSDVMEIDRAIEKLSSSVRGKQAMDSLRNFFEIGGIALDDQEKEAVVTLVRHAFGKYGHRVIPYMKNGIPDGVIDEEDEHDHRSTPSRG